MQRREWAPRNESTESTEAPLLIPPVLWDVLTRRGFDSKEKIEELIAPSLKDLSDPFKLNQMDVAVSRLIEAYKNNELIVVYADFDLDGTSALALLIQAFEDLGFQNVKWYQPSRLKEGYGFHADAVDEIHSWGADLIVTVDVGINAFEASLQAKKVGIDLVITDHHLPDSSLPDAVAIVNPNKNECKSDLGHLSGTGVAYYLVIALKRELEREGRLENVIDLKSYLDVFTIGTVTDMVPLVHENRPLVRHGLHVLSCTKRPGLKRLIQELKLDRRTLSTQDVGIALAPKLNALSRMEKGLRPIDILLANEEQADELIGEVLEVNEERKRLQKSAEAIASFDAESQVEDGVIWVFSREYHKGIIGLVAMRLAGRFGLPSFVGSVSEDGVISGSARIPEGSDVHLVESLLSAEEALVSFGGHKEAAGFKLSETTADLFHELLKKRFSEKKESLLRFFYDSVAEVDDINGELMLWLSRLEPFGKAFQYPQFKIKNAMIESVRILNGGHLKIVFKGQKSRLNGIFFSPPEEISVSEGEIVNVLGEPQWNEFRGIRSVQLMIRDLKGN